MGALALGPAVAGAVQAAPDAAKPNIVFILADDLGYADLGVYGQHDFKTPHLDRLASQGLRFTQAYSNSAVCSATRFGLITGRYQYRLRGGLEEPIAGASDTIGLPPEHPTLPSLLKKAGYKTTLIGKWHLGFLPKFSPLKSGYDEFFGNYGGAVDYFTHKGGVGDQVREDLWEGEVPVHEVGYYTDVLADRASAYLKKQNQNQPFLLSLHFTAPHWPWEGPHDEAVARELKSLFHYDGGSLAKYGEIVEALDAAVGRVLKTLDEQGLADNTIVIFTSDNGGERFSHNWPFSGQKTELLEGGIRVAALARAPEQRHHRPGCHHHGLVAYAAGQCRYRARPGLPQRRPESVANFAGPATPPGAHLVLALQGPHPAGGALGQLEVPQDPEQRVPVRRERGHPRTRQLGGAAPRDFGPPQGRLEPVEHPDAADHPRRAHPRPHAQDAGRPLHAGRGRRSDLTRDLPGRSGR